MIQRNQVHHRSRRAAFTLMEILVVVSIVIALAAVGGVYFFSTLSQTEDDVARMQTLELTKACQLYFAKNRTWPASLELLLGPDEKNANLPYLQDQNALKTPWPGVFYQYDQTGARNAAKNVSGVVMRPDIWAVNPAGKEIGNWPAD